MTYKVTQYRLSPDFQREKVGEVVRIPYHWAARLWVYAYSGQSRKGGYLYCQIEEEQP